MEYKFRGKVIGSDQWVYGNLLNRVDSLGPLSLIEVQDKETFEIEVFQVYPESVGMWTGLKDKAGKEIYQGDVIEFVGGTTHYLSCGNYADDDYSIGQLLVVRYLKSGFTLSSSDILNCDAPNVVGNVKQYDFWNHQNSLKIIGNITDHPHLLNPAKGAVINTMLQDPNLKAAPEVVNEEATVNTEATESAEGQDTGSEEEKGEE